MNKLETQIRSVAIAATILSLTACSGSGSEPAEDDIVSSANEVIVDTMLRGPGGERFAIDPVFANGPDLESLATGWHCTVELSSGPSLSRYAFAANGRGTGPASATEVPPEFHWTARDNTIAMYNPKTRARVDLANVSFNSDTSFTAQYNFSIEEGIDLDTELDTGLLTFECVLVDAASDDLLTAPPFTTSEGAAAWPRPDPQPLSSIPRITHMFMIGSLNFIPGGPLYKYETRIAFDDGTFTHNVDEVAELGIAISRVQSPEDWGEWQSENGSISFRYGDGNFDLEPIQWVYDPQPTGAVLDQCYGAYSSSSIGGLTGNLDISNVRRFCFGPNGVFSHGSTTTTTSPELIASSGRGDAGTYTIDGFLLVLEYGDGRRAHKLFGADSVTAAVGDGAFQQGL